MSSPGGDDLFILTNSEELVKDVFELFSKFNHPGLHGADYGRIKLLLCQGLAPTAYLVYYCVKDMSRIFFKSLTPVAGRRSQTHATYADQVYLPLFTAGRPRLPL